MRVVHLRDDLHVHDTVEVTATHYNPVIDSVTLTSSQTLNVPLSPTPLFIMRGEGNAATNGGAVAITNSTGVSWSFIEVR